MSKLTGVHRYEGEHLNHVAFPMGGIGAGMFCLDGTGSLSHASLRHRAEMFNRPLMYAALHVKGAKTARVVEGPVPLCRAFEGTDGGFGLWGRLYGLPRFEKAAFQASFPFATVELQDTSMPVSAELTGWSPFIPGDADACSLPVAAMEYKFSNRTRNSQRCTFSYHGCWNFLRTGGGKVSVGSTDRGFVLSQAPSSSKPWEEAHCAIFTDVKSKVDCAWFRGVWSDDMTMVWNSVTAGKAVSNPPIVEGDPSSGGSVYVPFSLAPGASRTIRIMIAWYVPRSNLRLGDKDPLDPAGTNLRKTASAGKVLPTYVPWYAARFGQIEDVCDYWRKNYARLYKDTRRFSDCFHDTTLPREVVEAVAANLTILKSPTCLRQSDGRFWGWEGSGDPNNGVYGTCTHVWNYAQAIAHLLPELERTVRETELGPCQDRGGHQNFRAPLPIRPAHHRHHAAADGQLGGVMRVYREWRISGDTEWMQSLWPAVKKSLDYCITTWDPDHTGTIIRPHHNTYDMEFWGAEPMCASVYLGALAAAYRMAKACGERADLYGELLNRGKTAMESQLFNGSYFIQRILRGSGDHMSGPKVAAPSPELKAFMLKEGHKYQYGNGCLSDGVLGEWIAQCCGLGPILDQDKVASHLASVYRYNFRGSLADHTNLLRPGYAFGQEGGVVLCSWPFGDRPSLPFPYNGEVWTGIEYQVAAHLMMTGQVDKGLEIVGKIRQRYDGKNRNPFNEYECGNWYARALSSYGLLQAMSGARYDAVERTLYVDPPSARPSAKVGDFRAFICTATGYGTVGVRKGRPFLEVACGKIPVDQMVFRGNIV